MFDKAVIASPSTIKFVPERFMTEEMCEKAVNRCFFILDSIPDWYKPQETCGRVASEDLFLTVYCPDKYITQVMCDEVVDDSLAPLKLIPDWFVISEMIKNLYTTLYADDNMHYFNEDSGNVVFSCNEMRILNIDLNNINLDNNFNEDDPDVNFLINFLAWYI